MDLRIFTEPQQGASYDTLLAAARATEAAGFSAFFRSDHYLKMGDVDGLPGPTDAWVTLAGMARETESIRLGTLVTAATFRLPGPLAISVAQVDAMSGGRVELGIGTGWYDDEHRAYGIPVPPLQFLAVPLFAIALFALFVVLAVARRGDTQSHKRLMLLASFQLVTPAVARWPVIAGFGPPAFFGITDLFLIALAVWDFRSRSRLHPVTLWGVLLMIVAQPVQLVVSGTQPWLAFARWATGLLG